MKTLAETARIAIIQFPGSNCERETMLAVKRVGMEPVEFLWNNRELDLADFAGYIIVGGFSYEDRSRAGAIAALDPIMQTLRAQSALGKPILGICNGAQILVETGLVPGLPDYQVGMALTDNKRMRDGQVLGTGYYNAWINMRLADEFQYNAFTRLLTPKDILHVPMAHAEGRFLIPPALLMEIQTQGLGVFQYCDAAGKIIDEFPVNPNGSVFNIAAVANKAGNVMAMMPHPERTGNGDAIFASMRDYIAQGQFNEVMPLNYQPLTPEIKTYQAKGQELIVDLVITDNQAMSVETALRHRDIPVKITRHVHWEIDCESPAVLQQIIASGVLYNDRKEIKITPQALKQKPQQTFLVRAREDMLGQEKQQMLTHHFGLQGIRAIRHSVLWSIATADQLDARVKEVLNTHILFNRNAHDCYYY
ncbi:MAG: phosphoribosylformylglycinamidine synthase I [Pseudomonadota bacterium]